jgi:hypothetical protein
LPDVHRIRKAMKARMKDHEPPIRAMVSARRSPNV